MIRELLIKFAAVALLTTSLECFLISDCIYGSSAADKIIMHDNLYGYMHNGPCAVLLT